MTKFVYKMESILGIKYKIEEQAKTSYATAHIKLTREEDELKTLIQKLVMYQEELRNLMQSKLKLIDIQQGQEAIEISKLYIKQQQVVVKKAEQQLETARIRLHAAMLERKTHERLKDKSFEAYILEYEAEQRKEIDELVSFKYNNPMNNQEI